MIGIGFALIYIAFTALCLSMDRHHQTIFKENHKFLKRTTLRIAGWAVLVVSLWATVKLSEPYETGVVTWFGLLTVGGLALVFLLAYRPKIVLSAGIAAIALALGGIVILFQRLV